jgi:plastocyanin
MPTAARYAALLAAAALLALGAAACGGDDDDGDDGDSAAATQPAGDGGVTVTATDFSFSPAEVEATAGEALSLTLQNDGSAPHTLTVYSDEEYTTEVAGADTGQVNGGESGDFEVTFDAAGDYYFRCEVHPSQMQGEIVVS